MNRLGLWILGRNTSAIFTTSYQGFILSTQLITVNITLGGLTEVVLVRCFHSKVTLFSPFPHCNLWKDVTIHTLHLKELSSTSVRAGYLYKLFVTLPHGVFVYSPPFICSFNPFYISGNSWIFIL